jgi:DNA-binding NtrC family response regulator
MIFVLVFMLSAWRDSDMEALPRMKSWFELLEINRSEQVKQIMEALTEAKGNISHTARVLNMSRQRLTVLMKESDLNDFAFDLRKKAGAKNRVGRPSGSAK